MPCFSFSSGFFPFPTAPNFSVAITLTQGPTQSSSGRRGDTAGRRGMGPCKAARLSLCTAQCLRNLRSLLQLSSSLGAWRPPLARRVAFAPSEPHLSWLKVNGTGTVSQEQRCSSTSIWLLFSPFSRRSWRSPRASGSEVRTWPPTDLCRDLPVFVQLWPGGDGFSSYSKFIYSK